MDLAVSLRLVAPEIVLSLSGLVLLLISAWGGAKAARLISVLAVAALAAAAAFTLDQFCDPASLDGVGIFYGQLVSDRFALLASLLVYAASAASIILAPAYFRRFGAMRSEYPILILFATIGMLLMVSATDFLALYVGLELNSLSAYVLASFLRTEERSAEAGLKYFVLGALASGILLYGMSLIYGFTGTTNFNEVAIVFKAGLPTGALFGLVFVLAGMAFKISAVPFHMWTPDVYEGAPTPVTTFFASAPKVAAMALTVRLAVEAFGSQVDAWRQIVIFVALASIVVGAAGAIGQTNIKRLLAYSSINNVGFMLIGLAAATPSGIAGVMTYLAIYVVMTIGSFACVLSMRDAQGRSVETIASMAGLSKTSPGIAWPLMIFMFSLAGIPPMFGFWGKFVVFDAAVEANLLALAAIGIAASVIGAFYYLKIVKVMFFDDAANVVVSERWSERSVITLICAILVSPLGYFLTKPMAVLSGWAAASLFAGT